MGKNDLRTPTIDDPSEVWRGKYQKQKLLIGSITSLLNKYGSSFEVDHLHSALLLTLMGHYLLTDSCYYAADETQSTLVPAKAYGRVPIDELRPLIIRDELRERLATDRAPVAINLMTEFGSREEVARMQTTFEMVAPLCVNTRIIGLVFLGQKIKEEPFTDFDIEVLYALCAASATTFNNAIMYRNAAYSAEEVRRLYDIRSEIIGRITHEFRTPLTVIKGGVELLKKADINETLRESILDSTERLDGLIRTLLELSVEHEVDEMAAVERYDVAATVQDILHDQVQSARSRGVSFSFSRRASVDAHSIRISKASFTTAVNALIDNAVKFSLAGAKVIVSVGVSTSAPRRKGDGFVYPDWGQQTQELLEQFTGSLVGVDDSLAATQVDGLAERIREATGKFIVIKVVDTGIGIPESEVPFVTEPFRQASNSPEQGVRGKGLGLSLAQKIVTENGGYLCCLSEEGTGTTISVFLPAL